MSTVPTDFDTAGNGTTGAQPAWKRELNEKIAAARAKRQAQGPDTSSDPGKVEVLRPGQADSRTSRVAATVAARYAQAPTYSEYLATEVRAAVMAAAVAQEAASQALAAAQAAMAQAELDAALRVPGSFKAKPPEALALPAPAPARTATRSRSVEAPAARVDYAASGIPSRNAQNNTAHVSPAYGPGESRNSAGQPPVITDPFAEALIVPATPLPAKLLEFPRELIAARKARPRHAEGPLREEGRDEPQLRIFEVEPEAISTTVEAVPQATEWSSIRLDAHPATAYNPDYAVQSAADTVSSTYPRSSYSASEISHRHASERPYQHDSSYPQSSPAGHEGALLKVASLEDRLMAGIIDCALIGIAFLLFVFVFTASTIHPPTGKPAMVGSAILLAGFYLLYQFLFFTFSNGTPGMLYARIALCTFDDDNPTRQAMRKRIFALVLAAMPLGLGFVYALFDEEHLGWHDRMTRMYQRSYK